MTTNTTRRTRRRVIVSTLAIAAATLAPSLASNASPGVAIIHPMPPIGNIDCCH